MATSFGAKVRSVGEAEGDILGDHQDRIRRSGDAELARREHEIGEGNRGIELDFVLVRRVQRVVPESAGEQNAVIPLSGGDPVVAGTALDRIAARAAVDDVVTGAALEMVIAGVAGDAIVPRVALVTGVTEIVTER